MDQVRLTGEYARYLQHIGINVAELLQEVDLEPSTFEQQGIISAAQFFRLMESIAKRIPSQSEQVAIASQESIKHFSPVFLAAYCSPNGRECLERMCRYKRLGDAVRYRLIEDDTQVTIRLSSTLEEVTIPQFLLESEMVSLVQLLREGTELHICPKAIHMRTLDDNEPFVQFMGIQPVRDVYNSIIFDKHDLAIPFITCNNTLWNVLKRDLDEQEYEIERDESYAERVRELLPDLLAEGNGDMEAVAERLHMGVRTLQRRLSAEHTSFTEILGQMRRLLAQEYLRDKRLTVDDVAFLLGYDEPNSLLRAFRGWTGMTVGEYRRSLPIHGEQ